MQIRMEILNFYAQFSVIGFCSQRLNCWCSFNQNKNNINDLCLFVIINSENSFQQTVLCFICKIIE